MIFFDNFDIHVISSDVGKVFIKQLSALLDNMKPCLLDKEKARIDFKVEKNEKL